LRVFTALWPGVRLRQALAACRERIAWPPGARPTATSKLHLTLHFVGALPAERLDEFVAALPAPVHGLVLRLGELQVWRGGLTVLSPRAVPRELIALHALQREALAALGLPVEARAFRPHLTLARGCPQSFAPPATPIELTWPVREYVLVRSLPDGRYLELRRYRVP
jgi:2'-5' RNA ligase